MSTAIYCDHCGQPCDGRPDWHRCSVKLPVLQTTFDLCRPCVDEMLAFIGRRERYVSPSGGAAG